MNQNMAGKLLLPAVPLGRKAPWILAGVSMAVLTYGLVAGERTTVAVGIIGLAGVIVAFPLARLVLPKPEQPPGE